MAAPTLTSATFYEASKTLFMVWSRAVDTTGSSLINITTPAGIKYTSQPQSLSGVGAIPMVLGGTLAPNAGALSADADAVEAQDDLTPNNAITNQTITFAGSATSGTGSGLKRKLLLGLP